MAAKTLVYLYAYVRVCASSGAGVDVAFGLNRDYNCVCIYASFRETLNGNETCICGSDSVRGCSLFLIASHTDTSDVCAHRVLCHTVFVYQMRVPHCQCRQWQCVTDGTVRDSARPALRASVHVVHVMYIMMYGTWSIGTSI